MPEFDPSIFRAYDMRGIYPSQMDEKAAYMAGQAFVHVLGAKTVLAGHDARTSAPSMHAALVKGITDAGADAIDLGMIPTEMLYFAAGKGIEGNEGGIIVTASHNPREWIGMKTIGKDAKPFTRETELGKMYEYMQAQEPVKAEKIGGVRVYDALPDYVAFLKKHAPQDMPKLKIAANANHGAEGRVIDAACADWPAAFVKVFWEPNGEFPQGTPDPLLPSNRKATSEAIINEGADFGVAWDADADRVFFFDEKGRFFHPHYANAVLIKHFLEVEPGAAVVQEPRLVGALRAAAEEGGGKLVMTRTGNMYIKQGMREHHAVFGGENSGHIFFRDLYNCDGGAIAFFIVAGIFAKHIKSGGTVSALLDGYLEHFPIALDEMNFITERAAEIIEAAKQQFPDGKLDTLDGTSIEHPTWRFNLRMSQNEPLMRLNLEAKSPDELNVRRMELVAWIESFGAKLRDDA